MRRLDSGKLVRTPLGTAGPHCEENKIEYRLGPVGELQRIVNLFDAPTLEPITAESRNRNGTVMLWEYDGLRVPSD